MKPDSRFQNLDKRFWANIRMIGEEVGYATRSGKNSAEGGVIKVHTLPGLRRAMQRRGLTASHLMDENDHLTPLGENVLNYHHFRAQVLNDTVEKLLMDVEQARQVYEELRANLQPTCPIPMNKQKDEKKAPAYFTGIINMLIEANLGGLSCNYDPHHLTTFTKDQQPVRTLARRIDGAFPSTVNPLAVWEIKEYYYTTTFGSRVADGIYESLLDGMELEEILEHEGIKVKHYLMVDSHYTWWKSGKSYLCRMIDLLHMGYVDEVLFGYEVVERLPEIVKEWVK